MNAGPQQGFVESAAEAYFMWNEARFYRNDDPSGLSVIRFVPMRIVSNSLQAMDLCNGA